MTHLVYTVALRSPDIDRPAPVGLEWAAVLLKGASSTLWNSSDISSVDAAAAAAAAADDDDDEQHRGELRG